MLDQATYSDLDAVVKLLEIFEQFSNSTCSSTLLAVLESSLDIAFRVFDALLDEICSKLASWFEFIAEPGRLLGCPDEELPGFEGFDGDSRIDGCQSHHVDVIATEDLREIGDEREMAIRGVHDRSVVFDGDVDIAPRHRLTGCVGTEQQCERDGLLLESFDHGIANVRWEIPG